jgi:hypothetical protein
MRPSACKAAKRSKPWRAAGSLGVRAFCSMVTGVPAAAERMGKPSPQLPVALRGGVEEATGRPPAPAAVRRVCWNKCLATKTPRAWLGAKTFVPIAAIHAMLVER